MKKRDLPIAKLYFKLKKRKFKVKLMLEQGNILIKLI